MGRTAKSKELNPTPDGFNEARLAEAGKAAQELAQLQPAMDAVLAAGIDLGRIEALNFVATVANSAILPIYENAKKSKAWQFMRNGDGRHFESLEEFCEVKLGKSYRRLRELTANRNTLGQEAFEQAEKLGLRQTDYNAIKALPASKQEMIKEALSEGADLETVTRALRQLAAEDQREIEVLQKENTELKADYEAQGAVIKKKDEKLNSQEAQMRKLQKRIQSATPDEVGVELRKEVDQLTFNAEAAILGALTEGFAALDAHAQENNCTHEEYMSGCLCQIERALAGLRGRFNVKAAPDGSALPGHLKPGAVEEAEKATAQMIANSILGKEKQHAE